MQHSGASCPKDMVFGPCGGVTPTGCCEVADRLCPFVALDAPPTWTRPAPAGRRVEVPQVIVDHRPNPIMPRELAASAERLRRAGVAALIGDHLDDPTPHPPGLVAALVADHGVPVIGTLSCRGRSVADLDRSVDRLRAAGALAIHAVTGDHPHSRLDLDRWPTFPLDGTRLAARAATRGAAVSVAESPASPPVAWRPQRVLEKEHAGAGLCILNHAGAAGDLVAFADACHRLGVTLPLVAPVPVVTDRRSAEALERFPGLRLPPGLVASVLASDDPRQAGVDAAVSLGRSLLASGRFAAVNLSGPGADLGLEARSELMADIAVLIAADDRVAAPVGQRAPDLDGGAS